MENMEKEEMDGQHHGDPPRPEQMYEIMDEGKCSQCTVIINDDECIKCNVCSKLYHVKCKSAKTSGNQICTPSFLSLWLSLTEKKRNFTWTCDYCLTIEECNSATTTMQKVEKQVNTRVENLENKVDNISGDIAAVKLLLETFKKSNAETPSVSCKSLSDETPWSDPTRVVVLKEKLTGKGPDLINLEKDVIDKKLNVTSAHHNKNGDTVIVCPSPNDAQAVQQRIKNDHPRHEVKIPATRRVIVAVVGLKSNHDTDTLYKMVMDNSCFSHLGSDIEKFKTMFEIIDIKPCKNDSSTFQIIGKVTDNVRNILSKYDDRLLMGMYSCKVYERYSVKRCSKCQKFGHWWRECQNEYACAKCGKGHETKLCPSANDTTVKSCVNCIRGSKGDSSSHTADSTLCPCYIDQREKVKQELATKKKNLN